MNLDYKIQYKISVETGIYQNLIIFSSFQNTPEHPKVLSVLLCYEICEGGLAQHI